jgi:hypothetical protein
MPRFFLHLRDGTDELLDPDGSEFADLEALQASVLANARSIIGDEARSGTIDLRQRIDAEDDGGNIVHSLSFANAVRIRR